MTYYVVIIIAKEVHIGGSWKIDCTGLIFFLVSFSADLLCSFFMFRVIVIIVYLSLSDYLLVGIEFIWGIIIFIIKKGWQCKAGRELLTPYQSEDPNPTTPTHRIKEEKGKTAGDKK